MITEIRGGYNVKRFHTTHRLQEETVGHHSANVCAILLRLCPDVSRAVLVAALMHDVEEVYTGDVPAPFKWENPEAKLALQEGASKYIIEKDIPNPVLSKEDYKLLKLADMLDLVLSSLEELNRGNKYAKELIYNGEQYMLDLGVSDELLGKATDMMIEVKGRH